MSSDTQLADSPQEPRVELDSAQIQSFIDACTWPQPIEKALALLSRNPKLAGACNSRGTSALHRAAAGGNTQLIRALVKNGAAINATDSDGDPPIRRCFNEEKTEAVLCMLELGAHPRSSFSAVGNKHGLDPMTTALNRDMWPVVATLLELGTEPPPAFLLSPLHIWVVRCAFASDEAPALPPPTLSPQALSQKDILGRTPLLLAARLGCASCAADILAASGSLLSAGTDLYGRSPLHLLPRGRGSAGMVRMLLEGLPDGQQLLEARDHGHRTPLMSAASVGAVDVVQALLERGADVEASDKLDRTALLLACTGSSTEHEAVALKLLAAGAAHRVREHATLCTPLHYACTRRLTRAAVALLDRDAQLQPASPALTPGDSTPFLPALERSLSALPLAALGAAVDSLGRTPLHLACVQDQIEIVEALVRGPAASSAGIDALDHRQATPLYAACEAGAERAALLLLQSGAAMDLHDTRDCRPVHLACANGMGSVVDQMLRLGVAAENHDDDLNTVMHFAAKGGLVEHVRAWMEGGASVLHKGRGVRVRMEDWRNKRELTPFMVAIEHGQREVVELCLERGADPRPSDDEGEPIKIRTTPEIAELLRAADKRRSYFYGRYQLEQGPPAHASRTCAVYFALDHAERKERVALKFMAHREQFDRELACREQLDLDPQHVVGVLRSHVRDDGPARFDAGIAQLGIRGYHFCLVMVRGDRSLAEAVAHEHRAPSAMEVQWGWVRDVVRQTARAVQHMHARGLIHGDLKPLNIIRTLPAASSESSDGSAAPTWKLIDLDAAARIPQSAASASAASSDSNTALGVWAGAKFSSAYSPPELVWVDPDGVAHIKDGQPLGTVGSGDVGGSEAGDALPYERVAASGALDAWALGCVLFELASGMSLFHANNEDNVSPDALLQLAHWSAAMAQEKVAVIQDRLARNLVAQLLQPEPSRRPSLSQVLEHPFVCGGEVTGRLAEEEAKWDVFLSYRVASDWEVAERVHAALTAQGFRVFLDKICLEPGKSWEEGFVDALCSSSVYLVLLTWAALFGSDASPADLRQLRASSPGDNLLLELQMALALQDAGMLRSIHSLRLLRSDREDEAEREGERAGFLEGFGADGGREEVAAVTAKVKSHLRRQGIRAEGQMALAPRETLSRVLKHPCSVVKAHRGEQVDDSARRRELLDVVLAARIAPVFDVYLVFAACEDSEIAAELQQLLLTRGVRAICVQAGEELKQLRRCNPAVFAPVLSDKALAGVSAQHADSPAHPMMVECRLALSLLNAEAVRLRFIHPLFVGHHGKNFSAWGVGTDVVVVEEERVVEEQVARLQQAITRTASAGSKTRREGSGAGVATEGMEGGAASRLKAMSSRDTLGGIFKNQGWQIAGKGEMTVEVAGLKIASIVHRLESATDVHAQLQRIQQQALQWRLERDQARDQIQRLLKAAD